MRSFFPLLLIFVVISSTNIFSQNSDSTNAKFLLDLGLHYGGDDIATIQFQNGDEQEMLAGQGLTLAIGGEFRIPDFKYAIFRTTIGLKYSTTAADNANIMFLRYPLNLMAFAIPVDDFRIGLGATSHLGAVLKGDGFFEDVEYESSFGPRIELGYKWVSLTYTNITFTDEFGQDYDGSSFGVNFSVTFPQ